MRLWVFLLALAGGLSTSSSSNSHVPFAPRDVGGLGESLGLSPFWDWKTIETEHFRVTFPNELEISAQKSAHYCEEAFRFLQKRLLWKPRTKIQVLVTDNFDIANGLATAALRVGMVLRVTPPDSWFSTAHYDNWLRILVVHELTHVLNLDPTTDWMEGLRWIFGDGVRPNSFWPPWMLEGLAVFMETHFSKGGRGSSSLYEGILRTAVDAKVLDDSSFITLDKINGPTPTFPGGEIRYLFGFQLMNQIILENLDRKRTYDRRNSIHDPVQTLGHMSLRSGGRIPFFINGNLENITGKDWQQYWTNWVKATRTRMKAQIKKIKSQPVSKVRFLNPDVSDRSFQAVGTRISPNGKWLVFTKDSYDDRMALELVSLSNKNFKKIDDKLLGSGHAFTEDSKFVISSAMKRSDQYYLYSDLALYDLENNSFDWLSSRLRARDPDYYSKENLLVFSLTKKQTTGLAIASLDLDEKKLSKAELLYFPKRRLARVSSPRFSPNGRWIAFILHKNENPSSELYLYDRKKKKARIIVSNRSFNRFPTFDREGNLYFVSDSSGVNNLYKIARVHLEQSRPSRNRVTNLIGGISFPSFDPSGKLYGSVLTPSGWHIAQVELVEGHPTQSSVKSLPPKIIRTSAKTKRQPQKKFKVSDYSIFPSIWPRQWGPVLFYSPSQWYLGASVSGFDATDRHRYSLFGAYDTLLEQPDGSISYSNRTLGPTINFSTSYATTATISNSETLQSFTKRLRGSSSLGFPFRWTYFSLTPELGINAEKEFAFLAGESSPFASSRIIYFNDALLSFSSEHGSRLAIVGEGGRSGVLGVRTYHNTPRRVWKGLYRHRENWHLFNHVVFTPRIAGSMSSSRGPYFPSRVVVRGDSASHMSVNGTSSSADLDSIRIRGYPLRTYRIRAATYASGDFFIPISGIFRGLGTFPLFFKNLYAVGFGETTWLPKIDISREHWLSSTGGGLRLSLDALVNFPSLLSLEYHKGFNSSLGGKGELKWSVVVGSLRL